MNVRKKLEILADAAKYDASCASSGSKRKGAQKGLGNTQGMGICHSYTPDGRCVSLLKILLTNVCIYDCQFCVNRISSDTPRARFTPKEVVDLTMDFYRRNYIEGLFLSSGIIRSADYTTELVAEVGRSLREEHKFRGYIHLKVVPGASPALVAKAGLYADRISANVELPSQKDLDILAPAKRMADVESTMSDVRSKIEENRHESKRSKKAPAFAPAGQSTQMVIGASPATDADILATSQHMYEDKKLRRVYYSAYSPIPHASSLLPAQAAPLGREHRLYQADWLFRFYGFDLSELANDEAPNLRLDIDPKLSWALQHPEWFPVDINRAPKEKLLRIPGMGVTSVQRILTMRRVHSIDLNDLASMRISVSKIRAFVIARSHRPTNLDLRKLLRATEPKPEQLDLFTHFPSLEATKAAA